MNTVDIYICFMFLYEFCIFVYKHLFAFVCFYDLNFYFLQFLLFHSVNLYDYTINTFILFYIHQVLMYFIKFVSHDQTDSLLSTRRIGNNQLAFCICLFVSLVTTLWTTSSWILFKLYTVTGQNVFMVIRCFGTNPEIFSVTGVKSKVQ